MIVYWIQLGIASIIFLLSTLASLYEGSGILYHIFQWKYTTTFSKLINGQVTSANDIVFLDYFVFAAKYLPTFPILMTVSGIYLLILIGYYIFRRSRLFIIFISILGSILILIGISFIDAYTIGGKLFFYTFLICGLICLIIPLIRYMASSLKNKTQTA